MCAMVGFLKTFLYIANFILLLAGAAVFGVSVYFLHLLRAQPPASLLVGAGAGAALAGAAAAALGAVGCGALHRRDRENLRRYSKILVVLIIMHGILGGVAYFCSSEFATEAENIVSNTNLRSLHFVERYLKCCGTADLEIYLTASYQYHLPDSCFPPTLPVFFRHRRGHHFVLTCNKAIKDFAFDVASKVTIGCIGSCLFEVVLVIFGCMLGARYKKLNTQSTSYEMTHTPTPS